MERIDTLADRVETSVRQLARPVTTRAKDSSTAWPASCTRSVTSRGKLSLTRSPW
jgi:hypothetical protein